MILLIKLGKIRAVSIEFQKELFGFKPFFSCKWVLNELIMDFTHMRIIYTPRNFKPIGRLDHEQTRNEKSNVSV